MSKFLSGKASLLVLTTVFAVAAFLLGKSVSPVSAIAVEKVYWCHCTPSGGCQTLHLAQSALENAGHVNASGQPLHAGDHAGACTEETVDLCTNIEDDQEEVPDGYYHTEFGECFPKTPVCDDDSYLNYGGEDGKFDRETEVGDETLCSNSTPEPTPTPDNDVCDNLDGVQTSVPDTLHLDSAGKNCVGWDPANPPEVPSAPQGQVLGATTMAKTGSFAEFAYLVIMGIGGALTTLGFQNLRKAYKKSK